MSHVEDIKTRSLPPGEGQWPELWGEKSNEKRYFINQSVLYLQIPIYSHSTFVRLCSAVFIVIVVFGMLQQLTNNCYSDGILLTVTDVPFRLLLPLLSFLSVKCSHIPNPVKNLN